MNHLKKIMFSYLALSIYIMPIHASYRSPEINDICVAKITDAVSDYALNKGYINAPTINGQLIKNRQLSGSSHYYLSLSNFSTDLNFKNIDGNTCTHLYFKVAIRDHFVNTNSVCDFVILNNEASGNLFYCL